MSPSELRAEKPDDVLFAGASGRTAGDAAALKTIEILENGVINNAARIGEHLLEHLKEMKERFDCIVDVRGLGLMIGVEFARDSETFEPWTELRDNVVLECFHRGLVIQGAGESSIRFSPPLIIDRDQADFALATVEDVLTQLTR